MPGQEMSPTILVVFGATGDLMRRKIVPSLHHLFSRDLLPDRTCIVGFGRRGWDDARLREYVGGLLAEKSPEETPGASSKFLDLFRYFDGDLMKPDSYGRLSLYLKSIDEEWGLCTNKLFYLAVPPSSYLDILEGFAAQGLSAPCSDLTGWTRVLIEKPLGVDEDSSKQLVTRVNELLREEQTYFIDHYLAKEMLQGIMDFRFTNNLFEAEWNRQAIERIDISLLERVDVGSRGPSFDRMGALRDVGQNHLLEMLALVTMEQPSSKHALDIRAARAAAMETLLRPMTPGEVARCTFRAQYEGYLAAEGVAPDSQSETYYRLETELRGERWAGVPVMMESGKAVGTPDKRIVVRFRQPPLCLCEPEQRYPNRIVFSLEPAESIEIVFYSKKPGFSSEVEEHTLSFFLYEKGEKAQYVEEYARLLYDAFRGDQTLFVSSAEIEAGWRFVDPIVEAWRDGVVPLETYEHGCPDIADRAAAAISSRSATAQRSVGIVGLGKMGAGLARNLHAHRWRVVAFNRTTSRAEAMEAEGIIAARTMADVAALLPAPRIVWVMVPAGAAVDDMLFGKAGEDGEHVPGLADVLEPGDTIVDGGNSHFSSAGQRAARLGERGIRFVDCGTSGGPAGARHGACLMLGGSREDFERLEPMLADVSVPGGYAHFPGIGAGHFVKMVHNGIEYGMMQAVADGFALMHDGPYELDLRRVADIYQHGSVVQSRLMGWLRDAYATLGDDLEAVSGTVRHTGEGEWTVDAARDAGLPVPGIETALRFRIDSFKKPSYTGRVLTALRNAFGGHGLDGNA